MNVNEKVAKSVCCGCGACVSSCPVNAIDFKYDDGDWHLRPEVNDTVCIDCGKCVRICPAIHDKPTSSFSPYGFAAVADEKIKSKSSSGGMFWLFAEQILSKKGYVAGAVFDDSLTVKHIVTSESEEAERMRGSKYVQSDASEVYEEVKRLLDSGNTVLFTGTPCQVAAMKNYIGHDSDNLICVDILCHGVPSPKLLDSYLEENFKTKSELKNISFRNKAHRNGAPGSLTVTLKDGTELYSEYFDNSYYDAFLQDLSHRESCFDCKFAEFPRVGDISIGDFWGAKTTDTKIDCEKGCSIVLINSPKGEKLWHSVKKHMKTVEKYPLDVLMSWNRNKRELKHNPRFSELVKEIERTSSVRTAVSNLLTNRYDVGVFGVTMNPNFGGLITYYALYEAIAALGYSVAMIDRPHFNADSAAMTHSREFFDSHCNIVRETDPSKLHLLNDKIDKFVLGSDQVWNYNLFSCWNNTLYFDFVSDNKLTLAYAASFGHDRHEVPADRIGQVSKYFKRFDGIGVREFDGVKILKKEYNVNSTQVCDPVFLLPKSKYLELAEESSLSRTAEEDFVGSYIIEPTDAKLGVVRRISERLGIKNLNTTDGDRIHFERKSRWFLDRNMHIQSEATVSDWLYIISKSRFIVTDSFHAVCFAIMLGKPFLLLQERWALSRIESLMSVYGLYDRWLQISDINEFKINEAWFSSLPPETEHILEKERDAGMLWLKNALASSKKVRYEKSFPAHIEKERIEDYFYFLLRNRKDYVITVTSTNLNKEVFKRIDFKCKLSYENYKTDNSLAFAMLYDFDKDYMVCKNDDYSEIVYNLYDKKLICLVDRTSPPFANNVYVDDGVHREIRASYPDAGVVISVYSKTEGRLVDSFEVIAADGTVKIKR